ncbi:M50 family metallopeptidase [Ructibacterium gallinarum]|uniref:M50 family metallopeptidase n=1 Tax=Ructibacterium gallinarum TaxID=2779355 RepID=A0A9D5R9D9_9FIRM|nr:M50 family metallopeptidase [Ructibacterium gallinarum]MBE5040389.1 M50 family metallopeptidase [Ructibacterium gallinarum]
MRKRFFSHAGEIPIGHYIRLHVLLLPLCAASIWGNYWQLFSISWITALCHEAAHIIAGKCLGIDVSGITLLPFGVCARLKEPFIKSPAKEIIMASAGPLCNCIIAIALYCIYRLLPFAWIPYAITVNLAIMGMNLLPCLPLDGGRILRAALTLGSDAITAGQTTLRISRFFSAVLLCISGLLLITAQFNFSLILIGVFLLGNLYSEQRNFSKQTIREILYYKEKLEENTLNRTTTLTAYAKLPARMLLRHLSYHRYYIIQVVDEHQRIIKTVTESQILDALLHQSIRITLGEI